MTKRTFQPKTKKRMRKIGFLAKMRTEDGKKTIARRRIRGRKKLTG